MKNNKALKITFSLIFIVLSVFVCVSTWAKVHFDTMTLILILLAFFPWIFEYIKSLEVFGVKAELVTKEQINIIEENVNKIQKDDNIEINYDKEVDVLQVEQKSNSISEQIILESTTNILSANDKITKLVLTRFELEKIVKAFSVKFNLPINYSIQTMIKNLYANDFIGEYQFNLINDILPILNKAIHSDLNNANSEQLDWVIEKGSQLLITLEIAYKYPKETKNKTILTNNFDGKI